MFSISILLGESSKRTPNTRRTSRNGEDEDVLSPMLDYNEEFFQEAVSEKGRGKSREKDNNNTNDSARNLFRNNIVDDDDGEIVVLE